MLRTSPKTLTRLLLLVALLFASVFSSGAQTTQFGAFWIRYYNQTRFTDKLVLHAHLDERILLNPVRQFQLFTHVHLNYQPKPWIDIGFGFNYNQSNSARYPHLRVPEWRPWQEATFIKPITKKWQFQFRYRLDERFIRETQADQLLSSYHFNLRHRLRPQFAYTFLTKAEKRMVFRISNEIMFNSGDVSDIFDQNRFYFSLEVPVAKKWSVETGYMNQFQSRPSDDGFNDRHLIRVSVYHRIDLRKD